MNHKLYLLLNKKQIIASYTIRVNLYFGLSKPVLKTYRQLPQARPECLDCRRQAIYFNLRYRVLRAGFNKQWLCR